MKDKDKAEFVRYLLNRQDKLRVAVKHDLALMADAISRLPARAGQLTEERVLVILRDCVMETELEFHEGTDYGEALNDEDEKWQQRFFS